MQIEKINSNPNPNPNPMFRGKLPPETKRAIADFTTQYLRKQDGYVSSKGSVYNGIASLMRGLGGTSLTAWLIVEMPKIVHNDKLSTFTQVVTGLGSLAVAGSRLENDRAATGLAKVKLLKFVAELKEAGFMQREELLHGLRQFMGKKGGLYTSILPNWFSSKRVEKILDELSLEPK